MAALGVLAGLFVIALVVLPQFWIRAVMGRHGKERQDFPGTGGELARHLLEYFGVKDVRVEETDHGDHYDSMAKAVRLSPQHMQGRSLTAVAVAAHEVGHALQHHDGLNGRPDGGLSRRQNLLKVTMVTDQIARVFFLASPFFGLIARTPAAFFGLIAMGVALLAIRVLVHLVTLPVEYDASFSRALPILKEGGYLSDEDIPAARSVLKAAAFTYVAAAAMSLIDLARWVRVLR